jgi:hypothetical protein
VPRAVVARSSLLEDAVKTLIGPLSGALVAMALVACSPPPSAPQETSSDADTLVGAWRSQIHFSSGAFAPMKDLEFMYVFNQGGTMTESSNYDAAPPVPPAYGVWRATGPRQFELKYLFYVTRAPEKLDAITSGGGWMPAGWGEFTERITLSQDGKTFTSSMKYVAFYQSGKPVEGGGEANCSGRRIGF